MDMTEEGQTIEIQLGAIIDLVRLYDWDYHQVFFGDDKVVPDIS